MSRQRFAGIIAAVLAVVAGVVIASGSSAQAVGGTVPAIDTSDRQDVLRSWERHVEAKLAIDSGWNGSTDRCIAGRSSAAFDDGTLETINWFRRMNGLQPVAADARTSASAQQAALMMHAAGRLSHQPDASWPCHSTAGAGSARVSNLTLGIAGPRGVVGQIKDAGASNAVLGHRRWLLYPRLGAVGIGNTSRANVVTVIGERVDRPETPQWVAWPPEGYVPAEAVFPRWSLSWSGRSQADFSNARVTMTENGRSVPVQLLPVVKGFGDSTLGWEPVDISPEGPTDVTYGVTVTNIVVDGRSMTHTFTVTAINGAVDNQLSPSIPAAETCLGFAATIVGTSGDDLLRGTPGRDVIVAGDGNDTILGGAGDDIICAGPGNDLVHGDSGADRIRGGEGRDHLRGGVGADTLEGQAGRDRLVGNAGADLLIGGGRKDTLLGKTGDDTCWATRVDSTANNGDKIRC